MDRLGVGVGVNVGVGVSVFVGTAVIATTIKVAVGLRERVAEAPIEMSPTTRTKASRMPTT